VTLRSVVLFDHVLFYCHSDNAEAHQDWSNGTRRVLRRTIGCIDCVEQVSDRFVADYLAVLDGVEGQVAVRSSKHRQRTDHPKHGSAQFSVLKLFDTKK